MTDNNLRKKWINIIKDIKEKGRCYGDSENRIMYELDNYIIKIDSFLDIDSLIKILSSYDDFIYPSKKEIKKSILSKDKTNFLPYSYSHRVFNFLSSINQLDDYVIKLLDNKPHTRRAIISMFLPTIDEDEKSNIVPCILNVFFRRFDNDLHISANLRSNDMIFGWPSNIYQLYLIGEYICQKLNLNLKSITTISYSAHIFDNDLKYINKYLKK